MAKSAKITSSKYRKLSPSELEKVGLSRKSERYIEIGKRLTKTTNTISARQYRQAKLSEDFGERVTLEKRRRKIAEGEALTAAQAERSAKSKASSPKAKRKRIIGEMGKSEFVSDKDFYFALEQSKKEGKKSLAEFEAAKKWSLEQRRTKSASRRNRYSRLRRK